MSGKVQVLLVLGLALLAGAGLAAWQISNVSNPSGMAQSPKQEFDDWVLDTPERAAEFEALHSYLDDNSVGDVVPVWQLTRVNRRYVRRCGLDPFHIPPRRLWPNILGPLKLVKDKIIPEIGSVEVQSSYRSNAVNECARGAPRSKHMAFAALDLSPAEDLSGEKLFRKLCLLHKSVGRGSKMGLGAYFDPAKPQDAQRRFHIDASGYRHWGFDYTRASSPCPSFSLAILQG